MSSEISIDAGRLKAASTQGVEAGRLKAVSTDAAVEAGFSRPDTGFGRPARGVSQPETDSTRPDDRPEESFRPWHFFVLASILLATVAVMLARQSSPENLILMSLTIASAGLAAAALYRMLAPLTQPVVVRMGEPVSERARAALEREKMLVLRSIKELEFDRAMGKVSQKDFDDMAGRLKARAIDLMRQLEADSGAYTATIERELQGRLQRRPKVTAPASADRRAQSTCPTCVATNDVDAVFCKKCGTRLQA